MTHPTEVRELLKLYETFQSKLPLRPAEPELKELVRFNGNKKIPVHRWYAFKEGFSSELLPWICKTCAIELDELENILDPFCGVGTSLLSAQLGFTSNEEIRVNGIEYNPFILSVAEAKLSWPLYSLSRIEELIPELSSPIEAKVLDQFELPSLSTIRNKRVFKPAVAKQLLAYRDRIVSKLGTEPEHKFFLLGWAAIIEGISGVRKDGRALRFKENSNNVAVDVSLNNQWISMLSDLKTLKDSGRNPDHVIWKLIEGDGRKLNQIEFDEGAFDLIIYSPPYLNNIDYCEVYKLELWLSGMISSKDEFRNLRLGTFRSHPSIKFPETQIVEELSQDAWARRLRDAIISALPKDTNLVWRTRLICGYFDDMFQSLSSQFTVARPDAKIICVVGNSLHGRKEHPIPIAADLLISALALEVGFKIDCVQVARQLNRRDNSNRILRESIIIMKK